MASMRLTMRKIKEIIRLSDVNYFVRFGDNYDGRF